MQPSLGVIASRASLFAGDLRSHVARLSAESRAQLDQVAQGIVRLCFEYLQKWRFHSLFGQTVPHFDLT